MRAAELRARRGHDVRRASAPRPSSSRCSSRPAAGVTVITGSLPVAALLGAQIRRASWRSAAPCCSDDLACSGPVAAATVAPLPGRGGRARGGGVSSAGTGSPSSTTEVAEIHAADDRAAASALIVVADGSKIGADRRWPRWLRPARSTTLDHRPRVAPAGRGRAGGEPAGRHGLSSVAVLPRAAGHATASRRRDMTTASYERSSASTSP